MNTELIFQKKNMGIGKCKHASARIFLLPGEGQLFINKIPGKIYFQYNKEYLNLVYLPLIKLSLQNKFNILVLTRGGGLTSQAKAIQLGITRLLCKMDLKYRTVLKSFGFLVRDTRIKERKKYGLRKARKAPQYSKR